MAQSIKGWILSIRVYAWTQQCVPAIPALGGQRQKNPWGLRDQPNLWAPGSVRDSISKSQTDSWLQKCRPLASMCTHTYIHTYTHTYIHTHTHIPEHVHACTKAILIFASCWRFRIWTEGFISSPAESEHSSFRISSLSGLARQPCSHFALQLPPQAKTNRMGLLRWLS